MAVAKPTPIEVDMVPYIDVVVLILMFLIITGDTARSAAAIKMQLPPADQAKTDRQVKTEGRVVIQLQKRSDQRYYAVVNNRPYQLLLKGESGNLIHFLTQLREDRIAKGQAKYTDPELKTVEYPVKLRIPESAPMLEVERLVMLCARAGFVNVQYAARKMN
jgi:biopolymer transport protein ExbD